MTVSDGGEPPTPALVSVPGTSGRPGEGCTHIHPLLLGRTPLDYRTRGWVFLKGRQGFPPHPAHRRKEPPQDSEILTPSQRGGSTHGPHPLDPNPRATSAHPRLTGPLTCTFTPHVPCFIRLKLYAPRWTLAVRKILLEHLGHGATWPDTGRAVTCQGLLTPVWFHSVKTHHGHGGSLPCSALGDLCRIQAPAPGGFDAVTDSLSSPPITP